MTADGVALVSRLSAMDCRSDVRVEAAVGPQRVSSTALILAVVSSFMTSEPGSPTLSRNL